MKREDLDTRPRNVIAAYLETLPDDSGQGYAGDQPYDEAVGVFRAIWMAGFNVLTVGQHINTTPAYAIRSTMARFNRPKYMDRDKYHQEFADRLIKAIYDNGMEIRP